MFTPICVAFLILTDTEGKNVWEISLLIEKMQFSDYLLKNSLALTRFCAFALIHFHLRPKRMLSDFKLTGENGGSRQN